MHDDRNFASASNFRLAVLLTIIYLDRWKRTRARLAGIAYAGMTRTNI
uniref:Uncharacterized protein n=1 Tax=Anguilla anguilla TaxID=7936 RepID=A0A0E9T9T8_ANGAN